MVINMQAEPAAGARERILAAASDLFYREGVRAIGVDAVVERAGVAKASLYHHFRSKDELAAAVLRRRDERWLAWLEGAVRSRADSPKGQILAVFEALEDWFASDDFRGCGFINAAAEFPDPTHPVREVAREHKKAVRAYLRELTTAAGEHDPTRIAEQLFLLMEGAIVTAYLEGGTLPARTASTAAEALVDHLEGSRARTKGGER